MHFFLPITHAFCVFGDWVLGLNNVSASYRKKAVFVDFGKVKTQFGRGVGVASQIIKQVDWRASLELAL